MVAFIYNLGLITFLCVLLMLQKDVKEKQKFDLDIQMKNRTMEEMAQEADEYRSLLSKI